MADTEVKQNGPVDEESSKAPVFDPDDPECQRQMWRPADIDQDMKEMERRKRVEMIMNSQVFREELERIIESQLAEGYNPANLSALQQVTELLLPHAARNSSLMRSGRCVIPINDIRGVDGLRYAKGEKLLRCKVAAVYRLIDLYGWSENINNQITVRVSQDQEHFLLNPFGLQYHEVTASSLLKVDMQGNVVDGGSTTFSFSRASFLLHSSIHAARPDIKCIIHIQHPPCVAISATKCGLLPISQEAAILGDISYYEYDGLIGDPHQREEVSRRLGPVNKVLVLRNHGVLTCGESIEEALHLVRCVVTACDIQVRLMPLGLDNLHIMTDEERQKARDVVRGGAKPDEAAAQPGGDEDKEKAEPKEKPRKWKVWDLEFEAQMRMLDNAGFRTGYIYHQPLMRSDMPRTKNDVEVPPSASSYSQYLDEDKWLSPLKKLVEGKKTQDKMRWVNSPNTYQKVEVLETGTTDPKKITKWVEANSGDVNSECWVQEGSPSHSTPIKIDNAHQFVPKSGDPNEFKRKQKELKENRLHSKINAGPQSCILEGVTWEEIRKMQDAKMSATGDQVILVGAASKGIIQREYQHNAMVYKSAYAKNPFDNITDQELEEYKRNIERKQRGEPVEDDVPDEVKHLLMEPVAQPEETTEERVAPPAQEESKSPPQSPTSPVSDDEGRSAASTLSSGTHSSMPRRTASPQSIPIIVTPSSADARNDSRVQRSLSAKLAAEDYSESQRGEAAEEEREKYFQRRAQSERKPKKLSEAAVNGEEKLRSAESGDVSATSRSSKEGSPIKDVGDDAQKKEKKKKKGIRTPSFLKKKKHKKEKEDREKAAAEA